MQEIVFPSEYFSPRATLTCGQVFRFRELGEDFLLFAGERACRIGEREGLVHILCEDAAFFEEYFDLKRDYAAICAAAQAGSDPFVCRAAQCGKGIRILRQDPAETIVSFLLSQNNNIPRIRSLLFRLCEALGERRSFCGEEYFTFPATEKLASAGEAFYRELGFGYRAAYLVQTCARLCERMPDPSLSTKELRGQLLSLPGIGPKVADCILLFGYARTEAFPVDTWVERIYRERMGGALRDREKIAAYFRGRFGAEGGIVQQYLFYYEKEEREWHRSRLTKRCAKGAGSAPTHAPKR